MIHDTNSFLSYENNGFMIGYDAHKKFTVKEIEIWGYDYYDEVENTHIILHTTLVLVSTNTERIWVHIATFDDRIEVIYSTEFLDFFDRPEMMKHNRDSTLMIMTTIR